MDTGLEWHIEGEPTGPAQAGPPARRRRRLGLLLLGLALPLLALGGLMFAANRRQAGLTQQVHRVAETEEAARRSGATTQFLALQDRSDEAWLGLQRFRLKQPGFYTVPELGLTDTDEPATYGDVVLEDGFARLETSRTFKVVNSAGVTQTVVLAVPQFYRSWGEGWVQAWPPEAWWGQYYVYEGHRLRIMYRGREAAEMLPLAARLDTWADRACSDWDCPADARYTVEFSPTTSALLWLDRARFVGGRLTLPVLALVAHPTGAGFDDPVALGVGRLLVRALALELSDSYSYDDPLLAALVAAEQGQLGLGPAPGPERNAAVAAAWRNGQLDLWSRFETGEPMAAVTAQAVVAFLSEAYPQRGERALLKMLRLPGLLASGLAHALGLSSDDLIEAWLAYGQTHWSGTAGRSLPQGELAFICGTRVRLRNLASGARQEIEALPPAFENPFLGPSDVSSLEWSPDGTWLALTVRRGPSDYILLKNVVTGEERNLDQGWFIGWAPDGQYFAVQPSSLGSPNEAVIYSLEGGPAQVLPEETSRVVWSPTGDKLAYLTFDPNGNGSTIWIAAADGTQAHPLVRNPAPFWDRPIWSPDGQLLAYPSLLSPQPISLNGAWNLDVGLTIVTASSGITRTLFTASDLAAYLVALNLAPDQTQVIIYQPTWSPDGSRLVVPVVWQAPTTDSYARLVSITADGRELRVWPLAPKWLLQVNWSPDGRYLAGLIYPDRSGPGSEQVWVTIPDSNVQATVAGSNFLWSPDGRWLAADQSAGPAVFSPDLSAVWRLSPGCRLGGWRPGGERGK